jgi:hypothetical protein
MAGPSILVKFLGDMSGLGGAISNMGASASNVAGKMHTTFSSALSALNQTGVLGPFGAALNGIDMGLQQISTHGKDVGLAMIGVGGALAGVGVGLSALGAKDQAAHQQLQASIEATGHSYDEYAGRIEAAIGHQEHFGNNAAATQDALNKLTMATHNPAKALDLLNTASDLAAAKHISLSAAADQLGKVYNGNTRLLKQYGIVIDKTTGLTASGQTATQALASVLQGQAAAAADTFMGKLKGIGTHLEDNVAQFGQKFGPAVTAAGTAMAGLGTAMSVASTAMEAARAAALGTRIELMAQSAATGIATAAQWLFNAAMDANPIVLVVLAVVALVAAIVLIATKTTWFQSLWSAFTSFMAAAFDLVRTAALAVFHWIQANWPLLVGILFGPFGLAAAIIVTHFNTILSVARSVVSAIGGAFSAVANLISAPFRLAVSGVESAVSSIIGVVGRIPGEITRALGNVGGILEHAGEEIIKGLGRGIENAMGGVLSTVSGIAGKIASLKGPLDYDYRLLQPAGRAIMGGLHDSISAGLPDLAGLMGTITNSINVATPASGGTASVGPAVNIESVVLADDMDVDQFMNRVAFKVKSSAL